MGLLSGFSLSCLICVCLIIKSLDTQVQNLHNQINQYPIKSLICYLAVFEREM